MKNWALTQQAFDGLLARFDTDRERAGWAYERARHKLIKYFEWRQAIFPYEAADETLNRVARKIDEGTDIQNLNGYIYGVARLVFAETLKEKGAAPQPLDYAAVAEPAADDNSGDEECRECLARCLQELPDGSRELIIAYYGGEGEKIKNRKRLAERLGIQLNALRIRAHRVRVRLETCVRHCLGVQE